MHQNLFLTGDIHFIDFDRKIRFGHCRVLTMKKENKKKKPKQPPQQLRRSSRHKGERSKKWNAATHNDAVDGDCDYDYDYDYDDVEEQQLRTTLAKDGYTIHDMSADGNCLFRAISDQVYDDAGMNHALVRGRICQYLASHKLDFQYFLVFAEDNDSDDDEEDNDANNFEDYMYGFIIEL